MFSSTGTPRWIAVRNDSGETAPAFAVLRVTGSATVEGQTVVTVDKPDSASTQLLLLNGPADIAQGGYGQATPGPCFALYDDAQTPAVKERWGPTDGSWELSQDQPGAIVLAAPSDGRVLVALTSLAHSYGCLSGDGSMSVTRDFDEVTALDETPVDAFGVSVSTADHHVTVLRDGTHYVHFTASVRSDSLSVDTPDTSQHEVALYHNGERFDDGAGSRVRLSASAARSMSLVGIVPVEGGNVLDVRMARVGNKSQRLTMTGSPTGGTFTLTYDGQTTSAIAHNASAVTIQAALESLSNIDVGDVSCTGGNLPVAVNIEFTGNLAESDEPELTGDSSGLTGGTSPTHVLLVVSGLATNEMQQITITGSPTGGTFTLTFDGQTTTAIAYNAARAAVQTALEGLSNIAPGDVRLTGGPLPALPIYVEFIGTFAETDVPQMTASNSLTGGTSPAITITTPAPCVDTVTFDGCQLTITGT